MSSSAAYVTLLTKLHYLPGALVLHQSLVDVGSKYPLVIMVTSGVPDTALELLQKRGMILRTIDRLQPEPTPGSIRLEARFEDTWTKLRAFELDEYKRIVLLDSDMVIRRNMDELMDLELPDDWIAAAHVCACNPRKLPHYPEDWIPENCPHTSISHPSGLTSPPQITESSPRTYRLLNSGTVVLNPSRKLADGLKQFLSTSPLVHTFTFADQDLLSEYFVGRWKVLPWCYNALKTLRVIHKPLWRDEEVRCAHYIFHEKPWSSPRGTGGEYEEVNSWWWDVYDKLGKEMRDTDLEGWHLVDSLVSKLT